MKRKTVLACAMAACAAALCFSACAKAPLATAGDIAATPAMTEEASGPLATAEAQDGGQDARAAYRDALTALALEGVWPDGADSGYDGASDMADNKFAIFDVDADGREELLVCYTTSYVAGQAAKVFAYDADTGRLRQQISEAPYLTFYDNGVIEAGWSHNQTLAQEFWPYTLYRYDAQADAYAVAGAVEAWERDFARQDGQGNAFPQEADTSGTGVVYYISQGESYAPGEAADAAAYESWRASYLDGAAELEPPYAALTQENIEAIAP